MLLSERYEADPAMLLATGDSWHTSHSRLQASTSVCIIPHVFGISESFLIMTPAASLVFGFHASRLVHLRIGPEIRGLLEKLVVRNSSV